MGTKYRLKCKCGYEKEVYPGAGLAAFNKSIIKRIFEAEELREFNKADIKGDVKSFYLQNGVAFCKGCKEIETVAILQYELVDGKTVELVHKCNKCAGGVELLGKVKQCPKCGKALVTEELGHWD